MEMAACPVWVWSMFDWEKTINVISMRNNDQLQNQSSTSICIKIVIWVKLQ